MRHNILALIPRLGSGGQPIFRVMLLRA